MAQLAIFWAFSAEAKEAHNKDILKLGKSLFNKEMKEAGAIIEQNQQQLKENARLTEENNGLKKRFASIDENAITRLRDRKDAEIQDLQKQLGKAESEAVRSGNISTGGGGSTSELTNWDGTKKNTGWGR